MKICVISKYPPLEGGIAAKTFWLCKAFAERGHIVHIVTDKTDISPKHSISQKYQEILQDNIIIHRPKNEIPWYIPDTHERTLELLNLTLQIIDEYDIEVIDTGYLIPYGIVGFLANRITGIPFILRHGGSDVRKFLKKDVWNQLLTQAFKSASNVVTDSIHSNIIGELSTRKTILPPYVPDPSYFKPEFIEEKEHLTLALIGKANYHWQHKGWQKIVDIMRLLGAHFKFQVISQGTGFEDFMKYVENSIDFQVQWKKFVHPLEMPNLLKSIDGLFVFEQELPFAVFSNILVEALYCGTTVITDQKEVLRSYSKYGLNLDAYSRKIISVSSASPKVAANIILDFFKDSYDSRREKIYLEDDYRNYISGNEKAITSVLDQ